MSSAQKKIVIKKPAASVASATEVAAPAVAAAPLQQKKVVVKTSAPQRLVLAATKKVVVRQVVEEEEAPGFPKGGALTAQQIYDEIQVLLAQLVQVSGGGKRKGFKKDGTPRAPRKNTSGWNQFVKEFRAENPGMSWKDAMVAAKADWAALKGEAVPEGEEDEEESSVAAAPAPAPAPAKKLVIAKSSAKPASAPTPPPKTAAELMAEAEAAAMAAAEAVAEVEVEEFEWEGQTLQKNAQGFCWRIDEEGEQIFVGRWDAEKEEMDETAEEPSYGSA